MRSLERSLVADYATVTYPAGDQAERRFERIIGNSAALESVLDQVEQVAPTDSTVLIEGETGTGKELIAHGIHNASQRCGRAFIKLNCAAIPLDLLESELFGHEKGAFTGAIAQKIGRFEMADKGTLFLDEVGDIPPALQPKLLRVLQEQEFERLGSGRTHKVDVRLVAATNRNLVKMVARGQFRSDLYYRLNVFPSQDEKVGYLAAYPSGTNQRSRSRARRCPDLRVELAVSHGIKLEVSKRERLERQTPVDR